MATVHLTDEQRGFIEPLLPPPARTGRPRADDRRTVEGILYVLITGCRWKDLPRAYGAPTTVWRRLKRWGEAGIWERIWRAALAVLDVHGQLDWSKAFLDGSFVPAQRGGDYVGLTRKGKGTKWMLVVDGDGLPLGFHLDSANRAEVRLARRTLDTIKVARPHGRPKQRPEELVADRGYDRRAFRQALRRRGIRMCIPPKRRPATWRAKRGRPVVARKDDYRMRFTVERSFAWLGNFRRLLIRWEHLFGVYRSGFALALMLLGVRRATALACRPIPLHEFARGRCMQHGRSPHAGARPAQGRASLLVGHQLPVPLGDDLDDAVNHFDGCLIVDEVCRQWHASGPLFRVGHGHIRHTRVIEVWKQRKIHEAQRTIATGGWLPVHELLSDVGGHYHAPSTHPDIDRRRAK